LKVTHHYCNHSLDLANETSLIYDSKETRMSYSFCKDNLDSKLTEGGMGAAFQDFMGSTGLESVTSCVSSREPALDKNLKKQRIAKLSTKSVCEKMYTQASTKSKTGQN
jgi:hypothetical protein